MKLIHYKEGQVNAQADPFILKANGKYYIYVSGFMGLDGVHAFVSDSLTGEYTDIGVVFKAEGKQEYWSPSVTEKSKRESPKETSRLMRASAEKRPLAASHSATSSFGA